MTTWTPHDRGNKCPKCNHADSWCVSSDDGRFVCCRRVQGEGAEVREDKNGVEFYLYVADGAAGAVGDVTEQRWRETVARPDQLNRAYRALVGALPLEPGHLEALRKRGLPGEFIERAEYASLPDDARRESAVRAVQKESGAYLLQVPGFFKRNGSKTTVLGGAQGLLVPVRNVEGQIVACAIRANDPGEGGKYRWLAAPLDAIGCGPGAAVHVPLHEVGTIETVRVTEGTLKADVATALSGMLTLGLPGVSAWRLALPALAKLGARKVLIAYDADVRRNRDVARALGRIADELAAAGYDVAVEVWPDDAGKGIDDVLASGREADIEVHEGRAAWEQIADIHAAAGAGKARGADARVELDGLLERVKSKPELAFADDVIEAAAQLEEGKPEFEGLRGELRKLKVRIAVWDKRVAEVRRERQRREQKRAPADAWKDDLVHTVEGEVKRCFANTMTVLTRHPKWHGKLAYDEFSQVPVALSRLPFRADDDPGDRGAGELSEADATRIAAWFASEIGFEPTLEMVYQSVAAAADKNKIHPVRDYLRGLKWDEKDRLDTMLARLFRTADTPYTRAVGSKWMISAVARVFEPGCQVDCILVLESETQGIGKSTGLRRLFSTEWYSDSGLEIGNKDSYQCLRRKWCHEFAELDSIKGREATKIKSFISSPVDNYRASFGRLNRDYHRQNVFAATTNEDLYLVDRTGNRRFWPLRCLGDVDRDGIERERDQLWAEARVRYERGERWHVDTPELRKLCEAEQKKRETIDPWVEIVRKWLQNPTKPTGVIYDGRPVLEDVDVVTGITTADVLIGALGFSADRITQAHSTRVGHVLREFKFWKKQVRSGMVRVWMYYPPDPSQVTAETQPDDAGGCDNETASTKPEFSTSHLTHPHAYTYTEGKESEGENDRTQGGIYIRGSFSSCAGCDNGVDRVVENEPVSADPEPQRVLWRPPRGTA